MDKLGELFRQGNNDELWKRCCGFIDLSLQEFMSIQERLLKEQLTMLKKCELGRKILGKAEPENMAEFRATVPLTTYDDYAPYLLKRRMDVLPKKPIVWQYTSGKFGEYTHRWAPVTARQLEEVETLIMALVLFSACSKRGENVFGLHDKVFYGMAPPPYATGTLARAFPNGLFDFLPPIQQAEEMSFEERIQKGFDMALSGGLDLCLAMSSVTVAIGDRFSKSNGNSNIKELMKKPKTMTRLVKGMLKSKLAGRPLMPKDIWNLKGLITFGIDGSIYRDKIKEMWGRYPLDFHGCTEAPMIAMQTWDYKGMTFIPQLNFFEFIPEKECIKSRNNPSYQPETLLMDELKPGKYELVVTSFHGGPFVRYRLGHLVEITSLRNEELDIDIPQMNFVTRVDDQIDIAGFTRLSEKAIWRAIENSGVEYADWTARKESNGVPALHLYIEVKNNNGTSLHDIATRIHEELKKIDKPYSELESFTGLRPLIVTPLIEGAFKMYKERQKEMGADITQLKPPHLNPDDDTVEYLIDPTVIVKAKQKEAVKI